MRNVTLTVGALEAAAFWVAAKFLWTVSLGSVAFLAFVCVGIASWRYIRPVNDLEPDEPDHVAQLDHWCYRLGIDTPEILRHQYTDIGERYWLRVTGHDDEGKVMTPEIFRGFWQRFRAVAGDGCRGVFISKPDKRHGGRCTMEVRWKDNRESAYCVPVHLSDSHVRMTYSPEETELAIAEASANGYEQPESAWAAPNPTERVGEG